MSIKQSWLGETCTRCKHDQRIAWSIKDNKWNAIIPPEDKDKIFCLECFLALADLRGIEVRTNDFLFLGWVGINIMGNVLISENTAKRKENLTKSCDECGTGLNERGEYEKE